MINTPPTNSNLSVAGFFAIWTQPWKNWFNQAFECLRRDQGIGTTAQRPTQNLRIGDYYTDTTINKWIWVSAVSPIVWRDFQGTIVP